MALNDIKVAKENAQGTFDEVALVAATTSADGLMSSSDKTKLNGIAAGAEVNVQANWTEADSGSDAFIQNKPSTFAPSAHSSSHAAGGSDPLTPAAIGAMYALETRSNDFYSTSTYALAQGRNVQLNSSVFGSAAAGTITLPRLTTDSAQNGDDLVVVVGNVASGGSVVIERYIWTGSSYINSKESVVNTTVAGSWRFRLLSGVWTLLPVMTHEHAASDITSGTLDIARIPTGTGSTQVALGNHSHEITALAATGATNGHVLTANGSGGVTFAAASGGGVTTGSVDNAVLRADGTGGSTSQGSAFIIADNATASPNNTVNHASIQATGGTTNVSVSLVPKGTGAFSLHVPDAATAGGNARGANAVDFQTSRSAAAQVASGANAVLAGGTGNTASGTQAVVCGGSGNTASGFQSAVLGGRSNAASNDRCVAFGDSNTASGANALAIGSGTAASVAQAFSCGTNSRADRSGLFAHAGGAFAATGDAQRICAVLRCATTTNAAVEMALDGGTTYLTIPSGKVMYGEIYVVGVRAGGADVAIYRIVYAAKNIGGTSTEVFSSVTTDAATGTSLEVATVDAGDYIRIRPTGVASQNWRWVAKVDMVEVGHG